MFKIIGTDTYLEEVSKLPADYREVMEKKLPEKLAASPMSGDSLGYPFLRESRVKEKRAYYLIYADLGLVLLVAISGKKDQQATIDHIKENLDEFRKVAEGVSKQVS